MSIRQTHLRYRSAIRLPAWYDGAFISLLLCCLLVGCADLFDLPAPATPPRITGLSPDSGAAGTTITISGQAFSSVVKENVVTINGAIALVTAASASSLTAIVPYRAGSGLVQVTVKGLATEGPHFNFFSTPVISRLIPDTGAPGTVIRLEGAFFDSTANRNTVRFGGKIAVVNQATDTTLTVAVPADVISGNVSVEVRKIVGIGPVFTVLKGETPIHTIRDISPKNGPAGTVVTISGENFNPDPAKNGVKFNGKTAVVTQSTADGKQLKATVPAFAGTGLVSVTINTVTASFSQFTFVWPTPVISSLTPNTGLPGATVVLAGSNFDAVVGKQPGTIQWDYCHRFERYHHPIDRCCSGQWYYGRGECKCARQYGQWPHFYLS